MDYPNRHRIKIWGRAEFTENDPALLDKVRDTDYNARPARVLVFHVEAWDVNCTQHIQQRFTPDEIESATAHLITQVRELKQENASLRNIIDGRAAVEAIQK